MPSVERRAGVELRVDGETGMLSGVALRFGDTARLWGDQYERFEAGSVVPAGRGVLFNLDHDSGKVFARTGGDGATATLDIDGDAVRFSCRPVGTEGQNALALVRSGVVSECSIEFRAAKERPGLTADGKPLRIVERAELVGVALLARQPAYGKTFVKARAALPPPFRPWL